MVGESATAGTIWTRNPMTSGCSSFKTSFERLGQMPNKTAARTTARYPRVRSLEPKNHRPGNAEGDIEILASQGLR